jgi:hypothetical protein
VLGVHKEGENDEGERHLGAIYEFYRGVLTCTQSESPGKLAAADHCGAGTGLVNYIETASSICELILSN